MLGYDWPRLHAALNDFPAALLLVSVLFDVAGALTRRDTLRAVGRWTLYAGVLGTAAAVIAGLRAEDVVEHSDEAHVIMEQHQTFGLVVLALFTLLAVWRVVRRGTWTRREDPFALGLGVIGVLLLIRTAQLGGSLTFDHALGVSTARLHAIEVQRGAEAHEHGEAHDHDAAPMHRDSVSGAMHTHADTAGQKRGNP